MEAKQGREQSEAAVKWGGGVANWVRVEKKSCRDQLRGVHKRIGESARYSSAEGVQTFSKVKQLWSSSVPQALPLSKRTIQRTLLPTGNFISPLFCSPVLACQCPVKCPPSLHWTTFPLHPSLSLHLTCPHFQSLPPPFFCRLNLPLRSLSLSLSPSQVTPVRPLIRILSQGKCIVTGG